MTRRAGNLIFQIADLDNIRLAFWKAKQGKEIKPEVKKFVLNLDINILKIQEGLLNGNVEIGNYHYFTILDPKKRIICAASFPERVLHHAIMNVCHPYFEKFQIYDSYATRINKGQYAALNRAKNFNKKYRWFCKLDIRKYFDNINHAILFDKLKSRFKDKQLLNLFKRIIESYEVMDDTGIPIGNLTSQYFANLYLGFADHFIKEKLQVKAYVRYMDDMVLWSNDKTELINLSRKFIEFIQNELQLKVKPSCINSVDKGLPFLGYVLFKNNVRLNKNSKKRFIRKMSEYQKNIIDEKWTQKEYSDHIIPLIAFTQYANTKLLRHSILNNLEVG